MSEASSRAIGEAMKRTWRQAAAEDGVQAAARRLRRLRGFANDPRLAMKVLGIRPSHVPPSTSQRASL